jgi:hypothetical protein
MKHPYYIATAFISVILISVYADAQNPKNTAPPVVLADAGKDRSESRLERSEIPRPGEGDHKGFHPSTSELISMRYILEYKLI